jgi:hypothetical protein
MLLPVAPPLSVVAVFYGTTIVIYLCPSSIHTAVKEKASAIMYTTITPMLNLFICSLRNRDLKRALYQHTNYLIFLTTRTLGNFQWIESKYLEFHVLSEEPL